MSTVSSIISPLKANPFATTAAVIHVLPLVAGFYGLYRPHSGLKDALSFPEPTTPKDAKTIYTVLRMYSVRQLAGGLTMLVLFARGQHRAMGWSLLVGSVIAGVDGWVAQQLVGGKEGWKHWTAIPVALGLGWALALREP